MKIEASGKAGARIQSSDVLWSFSVVETFGYRREVNGQPHEDRYLKGMCYHIRKDNNRLAVLAQQWINEGRIRRV